jgi:hypothetical protein
MFYLAANITTILFPVIFIEMYNIESILLLNESYGLVWLTYLLNSFLLKTSDLH